MKACAAFLMALVTMPLQAESRDYVLEMYDTLGQLVAIHQLHLDFGPEDTQGTRTISGIRTADQVDPTYQFLLGGSETLAGSARGRRLQLTLSRGILSGLLEIDAVMRPDGNGAFEGRWKRFDCFSGASGASGTLSAWPIRSSRVPLSRAKRTAKPPKPAGCRRAARNPPPNHQNPVGCR